MTIRTDCTFTTEIQLRDAILLLEANDDVENCTEPIEQWNTSLMTRMDDVFSNTYIYANISEWDTSRVESLVQTFQGFSGILDVSGWDTTKVTDMRWSFQNLTGQVNGVRTWNTWNVQTMEGTFQDARSFNENIEVRSRHMRRV